MILDALVVGSGPNGLAAAIRLAERGLKVKILEAKESIGGGMRTSELTLSGFLHDHCSAVHPMAKLSPFFLETPLEKYGLEWIDPEYAVAHPLDKQDAVLLHKDFEITKRSIGLHGEEWENFFRKFVPNFIPLARDILGPPFRIPNNPIEMAQFGLQSLQSARGFTDSKFKNPRAKALFAGLAAHSIFPLEKFGSAAIGIMFGISAHSTSWSIPKGGSISITKAMEKYFVSLGGRIECNRWIKDFEELDAAKFYLFDTDPIQFASICENQFDSSYLKKLRSYNFGPGAFKIDWALSDEIPFKDTRCALASTVHLGGTFDEISTSEKRAWLRKDNPNPYVLLCQQSKFDQTRAPNGKHTAYAYCHVANGTKKDYTEIIENQIERFAPGFKDCILSKKTWSTDDFQDYNPNNQGGAITGGAATLDQVFARPVFKLKPYTTPDKRIYICSASTPPGGGVHGMCGYHAANEVLKNL